MKLGFEIDKQLVDDGDWVELDHLQPGFRVKLRGFRHKAYKRGTERLLRAIRENKDLTSKQQAKASDLAYMEAIAETLIVTWEGLKDSESGELIPHSVALAREFMTEEKYALFQTAVTQGCNRVGMPVIKLDEDDDEDESEAARGPEALRKNSKRASATV